MSDYRGNKGIYPDKVCEICFKMWGNGNRQVQKSTKYNVKVTATDLHSMWGNVRRTLTIDRLVSPLIIERMIYSPSFFS